MRKMPKKCFVPWRFEKGFRNIYRTSVPGLEFSLDLSSAKIFVCRLNILGWEPYSSGSDIKVVLYLATGQILKIWRGFVWKLDQVPGYFWRWKTLIWHQRDEYVFAKNKIRKLIIVANSSGILLAKFLSSTSSQELAH